MMLCRESRFTEKIPSTNGASSGVYGGRVTAVAAEAETKARRCYRLSRSPVRMVTGSK
jgi:hypothetical protein